MRNKRLAILLSTILAGLILVYYNYSPASSASIFPSCPTYTIFGFYCPGCGTQRTIHFLLHGEISQAMRYNPLFVIFLPLSLALVIQYLLPIFSGKRWEIPLFRNNYFLYFLFGIIVIYFIIRNIPLSIFDSLRPPTNSI